MAAEQTITTTASRNTDGLASGIGKSLNVIDGRSAGQPEIESLRWC
jgi:hypothetical protein